MDRVNLPIHRAEPQMLAGSRGRLLKPLLIDGAPLAQFEGGATRPRWWFLKAYPLLVAFVFVTARGQDGAPSRKAVEHNVAGQPGMYDVLRPFWTIPQMNQEPIFFVQNSSDDAATGQLLLPADKILSVTSADGRITYEAGKDYAWKQGSNILQLLPNSRIPFKTESELFPAKGGPQSYGETTDGKSGLFFEGSGKLYQSFQFNVSYEHKARWAGYVPVPATKELSRTISKLRKQESLKLVVLGDSISFGACASEKFHMPPFQLPYVGLVQEALQEEYGSKVTMRNLSVGGTVSKWGVTQVPAVSTEHPDLVILGFGMNDASQKVPTAEYIDHIKLMIDELRAPNPQVEIILMTTMTANPDWVKANQELYSEYRSGLFKLADRGIAVADMTSMWRDLLKVKRFSDITGNGINHPNDFGHRVYAQVIVSLLQ